MKQPYKNMAIEYFYELEITQEEFDSLDEATIASIGLISHAVNEINAMMRVFVYNAHSRVENEAADTSAFIQQNTLLRVWSSKLFEFCDFVDVSPKTRRSLPDSLCSALADVEKENDHPSRKDGYEIARNIRHEVANHLSFKAAKKNVKFLGGKSNKKSYLHDLNGNSFYPIGEELMFISRMSRMVPQAERKEDVIALIDCWFHWCIGATEWTNKVHQAFLKKTVIDAFPNKRLRRTSHYVPIEYVGEAGVVRAPLFLRRSEG